MNPQKSLRLLSLLLISLLLSSCGPGQFLGPTITPSPTPTLTPTITHTPSPTATSTPTPTPSPTPVPPTVLGELMDTEGAIIGAEIKLTKYQDEDCVNLAKSGETLSDSDMQNFEACVTPDFASTTSGTEGEYRFSNIEPGWYHMDITWTLSKNPRRGTDYQGDLDMRYLILYLVSNTTPKVYSAWASGPIFYFSGEGDMVINFNYENPGY